MAEKLFQSPFIEGIKKTLKSLDEGEFEVKEVANGNYSVFFKRVVVIGPVPKKQFADSIAEEFNEFIQNRKRSISDALKKAEHAIYGACDDVADALLGNERPEAGQSVSMESIPESDAVEPGNNGTTAVDAAQQRQSGIRVQQTSPEVQLPDDADRV